MTRDLTARTRIRQLLEQSGPIEDPSGRATSLLMDAVEYNGSSVAFIQLIAAMDKEGQISRDIKGKRTYAIRLGEAGRLSPTGAQPMSLATSPVAESAQQVMPEIDYRKLARALVQELLLASPEDLQAIGRPSEEDVALLTAERDRLEAERDEFAHRLEVARSKLGELFGQVTQPTT
ncbi:hypothetical protein [Nocardia alni]|uniref:hypothetical protein n=1 Tax=Nocardia alni TaxID=2815723 RepID=UPI001C24267C|nr:hypothetical protein [Nocardia alni]